MHYIGRQQNNVHLTAFPMLFTSLYLYRLEKTQVVTFREQVRMQGISLHSRTPF